MKVALYARVSTRDKNQDPEVQLMELRKYCQDNCMEITKEYIDQASANDFIHRTAWKQLLADAAGRKFKGLLVWKLDRAFRDITVATSSVKMLRNAGIDFIVTTVPVLSVQGPAGDLMFNIYAAFAQFEKDTIIERVNAGLSRAKAKGKTFGRPRKAIDFNKVLEAHEIACSRVNRITKENQGYSETARILSEQTGLRITAGWVYNRIKAGN
jgi:DNA invertase Pin-like site-specific DNA recombinase